MKARCANCGEELLGAVNRCWRCGTEVATATVEADLPPIRQIPPIRSAPVAAIGHGNAGADAAGEQQAENAASPGAEPTEPNSATGQPPIPSAANSSAVSDAENEIIPVAELRDGPTSQAKRVAATFPAARRGAAKTASVRSAYGANTGGAVASLCLGVLSFLFSYFTWMALIPAIVGLAMGIWGLYSMRRGLALAGVVLCCLALAISGFNGLVDLYTFRYGHSPWDTPDEFEIYDDAYFEEKGDL